jgi:hypothetical protein
MPEVKLQIRSVPELAHLLRVNIQYLKNLTSRAKNSYRFWTKPKKSGGFREYSEPEPELKKIQRRLHSLFRYLKYPSTTHYGIRQHSNITNAIAHKGKKVIYELDLKDFFPSVHPTRVYRALIEEEKCSPPVASIITQLVTVNHQLPQGAPTSTDIANIVTFRLQRRLNGLAIRWRNTFTSYADDLTFSGNNYSESFMKYARQIIKEEGFTPKLSKEKIATKSHAQVITGVSISHGISISRKKRRIWRAELFEIRRNYYEGKVDDAALKKAENKFKSRSVYVESVKKTATKFNALMEESN